MKLSEAILKGMERFPSQAMHDFQVGDGAACVIGCVNWVMTGDARKEFDWGSEMKDGWDAFNSAFGIEVIDANDGGMLREDIVGMLQAIGH